MDPRTELKQELHASLHKLQHVTRPEAPITDLEIPEEEHQSLNSLSQSLEELAPYPHPLTNEEALKHIDGTWLLRYSNAREIRSLSSLPVGLTVGKVYQIIDVASTSFENKAYVKHPLGFITGYVRITATFEPKPEAEGTVRDRCINVYFKKRSLNIQTLLGFKTPNLEPLKVFDAETPEDRIPSLDITYLDEDLRIGRGGDGSLFILVREVS
ncbi:hypothetical protein C1752_01666 [Acaryochloris thomasi RCC1774]|uniref:Plastid lipid-associated protein/fibrillin conserved domain-containing protein n=1 Tax=Acaryochloris thomasi RCC1774 TaxID=1764569 RepID=A0A2W1JTL6_9CYAN|nr:PAP/fibrillin family protein [Acaryochloris thomasi]PZD73912.1 hypothetical protein C1752_01666 [Acaryochloris thomasi RCC1774]